MKLGTHYTTVDFELGDSHQTNMNIFKIQDRGRPPYWKSCFGHYLAADCPISVKLCVWEKTGMAT